MSYFDPTLIMFMVYIVAMVLIGLFAYRATSDFSDYILGGRSLGSFVTALSAGASDMSGWLLMGLPGAIYLSGLSEAWIAIGLIIGAWLNWLLVDYAFILKSKIMHSLCQIILQVDLMTRKRYFVFSLPLLSWFSSLFTVLQAW